MSTVRRTRCHDYDLAVVGGGSGGFGAALAATRRGLRVLLVESGPMLGGTSTLGGVNTWEPGVGGPGFHGELYRRLSATPFNIGVSRTTKYWSADQPWGLSQIDPSLPYRTSLRRAGCAAADWTRVTFEPAALAAEMAAMLIETDNVDLRLGTRCVGASAEGETVQSLTLASARGEVTVRPRLVVDASAQLDVCLALGCRTYLGCEPQTMYGEPCAPPEHLDRLNGVTLCFRVTRALTPAVEPLPAGVSGEAPLTSISITEYPCGDLNFNVLPVMEGMEFQRLGEVEGRRECERRVYRYWHRLQTEKGWATHRLAGLFPRVGSREGPRLVGRRVLTELDARAGVSHQRDAERWVAVADHSLDVHGAGHMCRELREPYGIAWDCLLPREYANLAVACRGASFSHLAAASCRLSRTIMQLGHATGLAAAEVGPRGAIFPDADLAVVRRWLAEDDAALEPWCGPQTPRD